MPIFNLIRKQRRLPVERAGERMGGAAHDINASKPSMFRRPGLLYSLFLSSPIFMIHGAVFSSDLPPKYVAWYAAGLLLWTPLIWRAELNAWVKVWTSFVGGLLGPIVLVPLLATWLGLFPEE